MRYVIVVIILAVVISWGMNSVPNEHQKMMDEIRARNEENARSLQGLPVACDWQNQEELNDKDKGKSEENPEDLSK